MGPCRTCGLYDCICPTVTTTAKIPDTNYLSPEAVKLGERMALCPPHDLSVVVEWVYEVRGQNFGSWFPVNIANGQPQRMRATRLRCSRCPVTEEVV